MNEASRNGMGATRAQTATVETGRVSNGHAGLDRSPYAFLALEEFGWLQGDG